MDVHVPAAVTRGLVLRGVDVLTAQLDGTTEMEDPDLLDRAGALARVLVSQDEDLLAEATRIVPQAASSVLTIWFELTKR